MKKFILYTFIVLIVLGAIFIFILYTEGAFEPKSTQSSDLKPFEMKCEVGKCASGKCGDK